MQEQERKSLLAPELRELLEEQRTAALQEIVGDLHPRDAAEQLAGLTTAEITQVISLLDLQVSKHVFSYLPLDVQEDIVLRRRSRGGEGGARGDVVRRPRRVPRSPRRAPARPGVPTPVARRPRRPGAPRAIRADNQVGAFMSTEYCVLDQKLKVHDAIESRAPPGAEPRDDLLQLRGRQRGPAHRLPVAARPDPGPRAPDRRPRS
jgi:hypothetical protein